VINVSTFLFSNYESTSIEELRDEFKKLKFVIKKGNTASFELPNDEKIKAYFERRDVGLFKYQLDNVVQSVWSGNFINGQLGPGSFESRSTSFTDVNCDHFHCLYIKGENLVNNHSKSHLNVRKKTHPLYVPFHNSPSPVQIQLSIVLPKQTL
jgi:hypothetical protein